MNHPRARDRETSARPAREIANRACRVACGLFIAHPNELDALGLSGGGDAEDGESDDAEHVIDALLLETAGDEGVAVDFSHDFLP